MEIVVKLWEITTALLNAENRKKESKKNSKATFLLPFPTTVQEDVFVANDEQDYLMVFKCEFLSVLLNLNGTVAHKWKKIIFDIGALSCKHMIGTSTY